MTAYDLTGRRALITGASLGLGLAIAEKFAASGADLFLCARGEQALVKAADIVKKQRISPDQHVYYTCCDVSKSDQVASLKEKVLKVFPDLTILVSNAGIYGPMGKIEEVDFNLFRAAIEINLLGPVLLVQNFVPHFRRCRYGKIIQLSGGGATNPLPRIESYAASKAGVVRFMESIARDLIDDGVDVNSVAPGLLDTRLLDEVLSYRPETVGQEYRQRMESARRQGKCVSPELAADACLFLASGASDGVTGRLVSAVWDDYQDFPNHLRELKNSDLYTLRRIVGRDRGTNWGDK
ncbi:MAG: SDR family oxidoreductase [Deltaproteobacteria bacterium]|jgi:NAD(P)-dependent dehydrogenase (short-subunit alcohol dehydrogenase family)|nr:SDR family oxidoreductase [Deltaproteobacteria bacterium]